MVFWDFRSGGSNTDSSDDVVPEPWVILEKMYSVFRKLDSSRLSENGVLQFWAPVKTSGRVLLRALNLPFVCFEGQHDKYRLYSWTYQYSIDHQHQQLDVDEINMSPGIKLINGPVATSFLNHLPDAVMDLSDVHHAPMLRFALQCELTSYFILPLFYNSQQKYCVGVLECFMNLTYFTNIFRLVTRTLKNAGLTTFCVQASPSYKNLKTLKHATYEIEKALAIVFESHDLAVAQVWIPYNNGIHNSSVETKQDLFAVKLIGYCVDDDSKNDDDDDLLTSIKAYHDTCDTLPLKIGEGLVGKTLETYEPHFCRNTFELNANKMMSDKKLLVFLSTPTRCSCFVICLRSVDTGNIDYAFEFLWPRTRNYLILLESLLLTLNRCLPSFKLSSGTQIGDELRVVDVENSTGTGLGFFSIPQGNRLSPLPKVLEEDCISSSHPLPQEDVKHLFSTPMIESARNLIGCQRPNFVKRKLTDVYESETDSNDEDKSESKREREDDEDMLTINVEYADDVFKFNLPISLLTIIVVKKEIQERCKLNPGTYKLKYLDEDEEWILMNTDEHIKHCIRSWRIVKGTHIQLRVQPL